MLKRIAQITLFACIAAFTLVVISAIVIAGWYLAVGVGILALILVVLAVSWKMVQWFLHFILPTKPKPKRPPY